MQIKSISRPIHTVLDTTNYKEKNKYISNKNNKFLNLPQTILLNIASFLEFHERAKLSCVHPILRDITCNKIFWKSIHLTPYYRYIDDKIFLNILSHKSINKYTKYLSIEKCDEITDISIKYIPIYCPNIKILLVTDCTKISEDILLDIVPKLPKLNRLEAYRQDINLLFPAKMYEMYPHIDLGHLWIYYCSTLLIPPRPYPPSIDDNGNYIQPRCYHTNSTTNIRGCWGDLHSCIIYGLKTYPFSSPISFDYTNYPLHSNFFDPVLLSNRRNISAMNEDAIVNNEQEGSNTIVDTNNNNNEQYNIKINIKDLKKNFISPNILTDTVRSGPYPIDVIFRCETHLGDDQNLREYRSCEQCTNLYGLNDMWTDFLCTYCHDMILLQQKDNWITLNNSIARIQLPQILSKLNIISSRDNLPSFLRSYGTYTQNLNSNIPHVSLRSLLEGQILENSGAVGLLHTLIDHQYSHTIQNINNTILDDAIYLNANNNDTVSDITTDANLEIDNESQIIDNTDSNNNNNNEILSSTNYNENNPLLTDDQRNDIIDITNSNTVNSDYNSIKSYKKDSSVRTILGAIAGHLFTPSKDQNIIQNDLLDDINDEYIFYIDSVPQLSIESVFSNDNDVTKDRRNNIIDKYNTITNTAPNFVGQYKPDLETLSSLNLENTTVPTATTTTTITNDNNNTNQREGIAITIQEDNVRNETRQNQIRNEIHSVPYTSLLTHNLRVLERQIGQILSGLKKAYDDGYSRAFLCVGSGDIVEILADDHSNMSSNQLLYMYSINKGQTNIKSILFPFILTMLCVLYFYTAQQRYYINSSFCNFFDPSKYFILDTHNIVMGQLLSIGIPIAITATLCLIFYVFHLSITIISYIILAIVFVIQFVVGMLRLLTILILDISLPQDFITFCLQLWNLILTCPLSIALSTLRNNVKHIFILLFLIIYATLISITFPKLFLIVFTSFICAHDILSMIYPTQFIPFIIPAPLQGLLLTPNINYIVGNIHMRAMEMIWYGLQIAILLRDNTFLAMFGFIAFISTIVFFTFTLSYKGYNLPPYTISVAWAVLLSVAGDSFLSMRNKFGSFLLV